jgi:hypothetical protein
MEEVREVEKLVVTDKVAMELRLLQVLEFDVGGTEAVKSSEVVRKNCILGNASVLENRLVLALKKAAS